MLAWHFLPEDRKLRFGSRELVEAGQTCQVNPPIDPGAWGLHASEDPLEALRYTSGPVACRVLLSGEIQHGDNDIACATGRTVLWMADATRTLHEFALWCAEEALKRAKVTDDHCWHTLRVKRLWLNGQATNEELALARSALWSAGRDQTCVIHKGALLVAHRATTPNLPLWIDFRDEILLTADDAIRIVAKVETEDNPARTETAIEVRDAERKVQHLELARLLALLKGASQ